jgi:uncharacterized membrane protein
MAQDAGERLPTLVLWILFGFTVVTLAGYASFGVNPQLLARYPSAAPFYGRAFGFFAVAHVWLFWAGLAAILLLRTGLRWIPAFVAVYVISLGSELMGTTYGIPFGEYRYTPLLGAMWLDRVPVTIPLSWFSMALPAFVIAGVRTSGAWRIVLGSFLLLAWDLSLDPAMSHATPYWLWGETGAYYGMPLLNLAGWYVTGIALMAALAGLGAGRWAARIPLRWWVLYYAANLLLPLGMVVAAGLWGAVLASGLALAAAAVVLLRPDRRRAPLLVAEGLR